MSSAATGRRGAPSLASPYRATSKGGGAMRANPRWLSAVAVAWSVAATAGCAMHGLQFRQDQTLRIDDPVDRAEVALPTTLRWHIRGAVPRGAEQFAVFVDEAPMRPGQDLRHLARRDKACMRDPSCPGPDWLGQHGVFVTAANSVEL